MTDPTDHGATHSYGDGCEPAHEMPTRYRLDRHGDIWQQHLSGRWTHDIQGEPTCIIVPTIGVLERDHGPTVELVPATRVAELEQQLTDARAAHQHEWGRATNALAETDELRAEADGLRAELQRRRAVGDSLDALYRKVDALGEVVERAATPLITLSAPTAQPEPGDWISLYAEQIAAANQRRQANRNETPQVDAQELLTLVDEHHGLVSHGQTIEAAELWEQIRAAVLGSPPPRAGDEAGVDTDSISDGYHTFGELYAHRRALTAVLASAAASDGDAWRSKQHHPDDSPIFDGGWFIVGIVLPTGTITYHYQLAHWDDFAAVPELPHAPKWDGATADDTVARCLELARLVASGRYGREPARGQGGDGSGDAPTLPAIPVGTRVQYWPGARVGEGIESRTRSEPWLLGGHTPAVAVEGHAGCVALTHVEALDTCSSTSGEAERAEGQG